MSTDLVTRIIGRAKGYSNGTWAEFDFDLVNGSTTNVELAINSVVIDERGPVTEASTDDELAARTARRAELRTLVDAELAQRIAAARARGFIGWATGERIRYADEAAR